MTSLNPKDLGQVLVAEYYYKYTANNGNIITINVGEEFVLIKKSNDDWWQVIKQDQKKPFYVPAAYMKEINRYSYPDHSFFKKAYATLQKQKKKTCVSNSPNLNSKRHSLSHQQLMTGSKENLFDLSSRNKYSALHASTDSLDHFIENENPYDEVPLESKFSLPSKIYRESGKIVEYDEPEYENLENIQKNIAESKPLHHTSPQMTKKEPELEQIRHFSLDESQITRAIEQNSDLARHFSRAQDDLKQQPRLPFDQSPGNFTTVEVPDGDWIVQLDDQTNSKYYYNTRTGEMNITPPKNTPSSPKQSNINRTTPPTPPHVSKKPNRLHTSKSPDPDFSPMIERRATSPARIDVKETLPEVVNVTKLPVMPSLQIECENALATKSKSKNSDVEKNPSFRSRFFRESERKKNKNKHKKTHSDVASSNQETTSHSTSPPFSRASDDDQIIVPPGWLKERSTEGAVVLVRKSNGDRWMQMHDKKSDRDYYINLLTNQSSWNLPELHASEISERLPNDGLITKAFSEEDDDDKLVEKSSRSTRNFRVRKASTIERETVSANRKDEFNFHSPILPSDNFTPTVKPRKGFRNQANRVIIAQSLYLPHNSQLSNDSYLSQSSRSAITNQRDSSMFAPMPHPMIKIQGRLSWTKLVEAGKKQKKHWIQQWVVLLANNLLFYKDEKQAAMTKNSLHGKPESSCDLRGGSVDWAKDKSSKKNVIEVQTIRGLSFLLQHDDLPTVQKWLNEIKDTIITANQADDFDVSRLSIVDNEDETDFKKKKDKKKKQRPMRHNSDAKSSDVRSRLKKFISRRPTLESLQERGIIKETVFGCPLDKLCEKESSTIPQFVKLCVEEVEKRGLDVDGIYRVSGNLSHVQKLRYLIDRDEPVNLSETQWDDIHLITGALKMFLRELPEPVIPFDFFDKFVMSCKIQNDSQRINTMKCLVSVLPKVNADTLRYLMKHFCKVVEYSSKNRMHVQNIAIVFGPTLLLKPPDENHIDIPGNSHMAVYMVYQNQIIDEMLTHFDTIFGE